MPKTVDIIGRMDEYVRVMAGKQVSDSKPPHMAPAKAVALWYKELFDRRDGEDGTMLCGPVRISAGYGKHWRVYIADRRPTDDEFETMGESLSLELVNRALSEMCQRLLVRLAAYQDSLERARADRERATLDETVSVLTVAGRQLEALFREEGTT
jgi:hypothetical protein